MLPLSGSPASSGSPTSPRSPSSPESSGPSSQRLRRPQSAPGPRRSHGMMHRESDFLDQAAQTIEVQPDFRKERERRMKRPRSAIIEPHVEKRKGIRSSVSSPIMVLRAQAEASAIARASGGQNPSQKFFRVRSLPRWSQSSELLLRIEASYGRAPLRSINESRSSTPASGRRVGRVQ